SLSYAPLFSIVWCRHWSAPVIHQVQGSEEVLLEGNSLLPLAMLVAPENCRYHAASKVLGFTNPVALPFGGPTLLWFTAWAYHRITAPPSCLYQGWCSFSINPSTNQYQL